MDAWPVLDICWTAWILLTRVVNRVSQYYELKRTTFFSQKQSKKLTVFSTLPQTSYIYLAYKGGLLYSVPSRKHTKQKKQLISLHYSSHFHPFLCPCFLYSIFAYSLSFLSSLLIFPLSNSLLPPVYTWLDVISLCLFSEKIALFFLYPSLVSGKKNVSLCLDDESALLITLNGKTDDHLDMLNSGIIYRLLEEKWKAFARVRKSIFTSHDYKISYKKWVRNFGSFCVISFII